MTSIISLYIQGKAKSVYHKEALSIVDPFILIMKKSISFRLSESN